jgi:Ran GTPase-activating protein (RanGAP) involved in mRNA processing and transport
VRNDLSKSPILSSSQLSARRLDLHRAIVAMLASRLQQDFSILRTLEKRVNPQLGDRKDCQDGALNGSQLSLHILVKYKMELIALNAELSQCALVIPRRKSAVQTCTNIFNDIAALLSADDVASILDREPNDKLESKINALSALVKRLVAVLHALTDSNLKKLQSEATSLYVEMSREQWQGMHQRPLHNSVLQPEPEPVTVATKEQLQPLFEFLQQQVNIPTDRARLNQGIFELSFIKGTICSDGRLDLCKQVIGPQGVEGLLATLERDSARKDAALVKSILLGNNVAGDGLGSAISRFIKSGKSQLTTWYIAGNRLSAAGIEPVCAALAHDSLVKQLWLKRNPLLSAGSSVLAGLLSTNTYLQVLDLTNTGMMDDGVVSVMTALAHNTALQYLYLDGNGIGLPGVSAIAGYLSQYRVHEDIKQHLPQSGGLLGLSMGCNRVGDDGAVLLAEALHGQTQLKRLCIASCGIGSRGAQALAGMLRHNNTLQYLDLGFLKMTAPLGEIPNRIESQGLVELADALAQSNCTLLSLDVSANTIGQPGFRALEQALIAQRRLVANDYDESALRCGLIQVRLLQSGPQQLKALTVESINLNLQEKQAWLRQTHGLTTADIEALVPRHLAEIASVYRLGHEYKS